jgi:hypothetical protein
MARIDCCNPYGSSVSRQLHRTRSCGTHATVFRDNTLKIQAMSFAVRFAVVAMALSGWSHSAIADDMRSSALEVMQAQYQRPSQRETPPPSSVDQRGPRPPMAPLKRPTAPIPAQPERGPAFTEECVWLGKRIVSLLFRDDAMAANDFIPFYDRFQCPKDHLAKAFGCLGASGEAIENDNYIARVDQCWDDPAYRSSPTAAPGPAPAAETAGPKAKNGN